MRALLHVALAVSFGACGRVDFEPVQPGGDCAAFSLEDATVNPSTHLTLQPTGANGGTSFTLTGPGTITATTFVSPAFAATSSIIATDSVGCTASATITTGGNALFWIGGAFNNVPTSDVWRTADGLSWTRVGSLPAVRANMASAVFHDAMWLIGGSTNISPTGQTNIWMSTDGAAWIVAGAFPIALTDSAAIGFHDRLWVVGGHGNPGGVWSSPDGTTWTHESSLPLPLHGGQLLAADDRLIYLGGHDDASYYDSEYASADGNAWATVGNLASKREFEGLAVHDTTFVLAGGENGTSFLGDSFRSTDGVAWTPGGALPAVRTEGRLEWILDRFVFVGGADGGDVWSTVDGASWTVETTVLTSRYAGSLLLITPHP